MQSQLKTLLILLILAALMVGGGLWWWVNSSGSAPSTQQGQFPQDNGSNLPDNSPITTSNGQAATGAATSSVSNVGDSVSAYSSAYQDLFAQLGATAIAFQPVGGNSTGDYKSLYALYASDIKAQVAADAQASTTLDMALVDLTGDGQPEALVFENLPYFCGSGGCPLDFYKKTNGKWTKFSSSFASNDYIGASNTISNGYLDLYVTVQMVSTTNQSVVTLFRWDGSIYKTQQVVAAWDGTAFRRSYK